MIRLFHSMIFRLKRNKIALILLMVFLVLPFIFIVKQYIEKDTIDSLFHLQMCYISVFIAVFVSLFIGVEYSDGTLRNKIIVGHRRYKIYLSNLLFLILIALSMFAMYMLILACVGIPLLGTPQSDGLTLFYSILSEIFAIIAFVCLFTFITFVSSNRILTTILNILLSFGIILCIFLLMNKLLVPEYIEIYQWNQALGSMETITVLNPKYPGQLEKNLIYSILYMLPSSTSFAVLFGFSFNIMVSSITLGCLSIILSSLGVGIFSLKNLK